MSNQEKLLVQKHVSKEVNRLGLSLTFQANTKIINYVLGQQEPLKIIQQLLKVVQKNRSIDVQQVEQAIFTLNGGSIIPDRFQLLNSEQVPRLIYDKIRGQYVIDRQINKEISPQDKQGVYRSRLQLVEQRIKDSNLFSASVLNSSYENQQIQLCEIRSLESRINQSSLIFGMLSFNAKDLYLEDQFSQLKLDISQAQKAPGYYTEGCCVIIEGLYLRNGIFEVKAIAHPPYQPRSENLERHQRLHHFGESQISIQDLQALELESKATQPGPYLLAISNVYLNLESTFTNFEALLQDLDDSGVPPVAIILMGNFSTTSTNIFEDTAKAQLSFDKLFKLIDKFQSIKSNSNIVLVAGPNDQFGWPQSKAKILPQGPISDLIDLENTQSRNSNIYFASNPCRIRLYAKEILIFRYNINATLRKHNLFPVDLNETPEDGWDYVVNCLSSQAHLCPLTRQPQVWMYEPMFQLNPNPNLILLSDEFTQSTFTQLQESIIANVGSIHQTQAIVYYIGQHRCEKFKFNKSL